MKKASTHEPDMASRYIDETLLLIDRAGGSSGVNLREVSRSLGCAHTNAYNYFESLDDLLWRARVVAFERQYQHTRAAMGRADPGHSALEKVIASQIDFALEHPGWFSFVWLEAVPRQTPEPMASALARASLEFIELVSGLSPAKLTKPQAAELADLFHTFLHGALCKAVTGRVHSDSTEEVRRKLVLDVRRMFEVLVREVRRRTGHTRTQRRKP